MPYDPALLTELDWVRFLSKDTVTTYRLPDETLEALLASEGNRWLAAALALELGVLNLTDNAIKSKRVANLDITYGGKTGEEGIANYVKYLRFRGLWEAAPQPKLFEVM